MSKLKIALFDMDGLMIDSERTFYNSWSFALKPMGIDLPIEEFVNYVGHRYDEIKELFKANHPDFDAFDRLEAESSAYFTKMIDSGIPIKPGLTEILDELDRLGIDKVIVSSSSNDHVARVLKPSGVQSRFIGVVGGQRVKKSKPNPEIFLLACEEYGVRPDECIIFEDSIAGVMAAHAASIPVICIPDLKPLPEELSKDCYAVCNTLADAIPHIQNMVG